MSDDTGDGSGAQRDAPAGHSLLGKAPRKRYAHLKRLLACPHCGRLATVYRVVDDCWICGGNRCGRSFAPHHRDVAAAELREDAGEPLREPMPRLTLYR
jgi:ribosomal protein L37AE/L43A